MAISGASAADARNPHHPTTSAASVGSPLARCVKDDDCVFTECSFCGASPGDEDDIGDDDFCNAFANSISQNKATPTATAGKEARPPVTLKKCNRCKAAAYCSRKCQQKHYPKHKKLCRKIGDSLKTNASGSETSQAGEDRNNGAGINNAESSNNRAISTEAKSGLAKTKEDTFSTKEFHSLPIKGVPAPTDHPRTSIMDPIELPIMNSPIVLHCEGAMSRAFRYTGVYCLNHDGFFVRNLDMTEKLCYEISGRIHSEFEELGYCFDFCLDDDDRCFFFETRSHTGEVCWGLKTNFGETCFVELNVPRSRDKKFWTDPNSLLFMHPQQVYSPWMVLERKDEGVKADPRNVANIALTPLESLSHLMKTRLTPPRNIPLKYKKASDFEAWDRNFVLHVDHRNCQVPSEWVNSLAGVYKPMQRRLVNGYPVWERDYNCSRNLVDSMPSNAKQCLERHGITLSHPVNDSPKCLYVSKIGHRFPSILALAETGDIKDSTSRRNHVLEASRVPDNMSELLSESASLFTAPDKAFATWQASFQGQWVDMYVALTPEESFQGAIRLAEIDAEFSEKDAPDSKKKSKKKNRKKKSAPIATANVSSNADLSEKPNKKPNDDPVMSDAISANGTTEVGNSIDGSSSATSTLKKKNKKAKKKKKNGASQPNERSIGSLAPNAILQETKPKEDIEKLDDKVQLGAELLGLDMVTLEDGIKSLEDQLKKRAEVAYEAFRVLASITGADSSKVPSSSISQDEISAIKELSMGDLFQFLFSTDYVDFERAHCDPAWIVVYDSVSAPILEAALTNNDAHNWIEDNSSQLMMLFSKKSRQSDLSVLINAGLSISAKSVAELFSNLPRGRGDQFNNKIAKILSTKCKIVLESEKDFKLVLRSMAHSIGKGSKKEIIEALKTASAEQAKLKKQRSRDTKDKISKPEDAPLLESDANSKQKQDIDDSVIHHASRGDNFSSASYKIKDALQWYSLLLDDLVKTASHKSEDLEDSDMKFHCADEIKDESVVSTTAKKPAQVLTSEEVVAALSSCDTEDALTTVETSVDLLQWDGMSEWTIDITEQAHKWFRRHTKKDRPLCERVIRRLTLLSTGRWPYVLCKRLKSKSTSCSLYETKVDSASRIIWEVAIAFSPRRSSLDQNYCEQVIRVWDIVLDHDNLSRAIEKTIERIEKSHQRGEECAMYSEIDIPTLNNKIVPSDRIGNLRIPRVFSMQQEVTCLDSIKPQAPMGKSHHFHPASDDPRQFTLLKFYELNAEAVKMLLDGQDENMDLPFTPGPKEHKIIHFQSKPQRSILLMGRSGTGKTTCLVFRMWAQYASYFDGVQNTQPRQLFLTKNDVLCREVERSFKNMGLAWRKRSTKNPSKLHLKEDIIRKEEQHQESKLPIFLTSSEWLDILDSELPGDHFFTPFELEQRAEIRREKDFVTKGVETWLGHDETDDGKAATITRQEMTFVVFRKLWRKIRSGTRSQMDSVLVWKEIKSFIKGSVPALQIGREDRTLIQNRFLGLEEYLALPRKQSRMDESQRREVYELFCNYEKLKKEGGYFDECDLVYNIAGRVSIQEAFENTLDAGGLGLLPIDSLFVDEVQDFTQAELYILSKLCSDPNNLFLAGDTAQSIAVGVDFRFTDVRQIFYNNFGGVEPKLLQLTHNYRSHSGVLRLAACVVELLYHFFSNSLDRLPPDLGLFSGPKPVIMEVSSTADLVLMLDGAKRETSRIEFGAHQVVIVRSEDAKNNLPEEFGVDRDWVMTVQESKGLEFDDVLLYNFFTDSPAEDLWRVVSNYTEGDIQNYYAEILVESSGVQKFEWENPILSETRHLDFSCEQHKILETELKMLYTAITRARVNVFIAETNTEQCRPMFNYFQRRCVVDVVNKDKSEGLSGVRVFGAMNTVEDWRNRGEYYLQNAEGQRQKGCLRLAAKCFDKAGEIKRRDYALAFLSFTEIEDQDSTKKRGKQGIESKARLYDITEQLLGARDVGFLNKAALCLLRTGDHDEETAQMFELYARLCFIQRVRQEKKFADVLFPPSLHEKNYFNYAGRLFARCIRHLLPTSTLALDSFRNYACAGMYDDAAQLLVSGALPLRDGQTIRQLRHICTPSHETEKDPIAFFQRNFQESDECKALREAVKMAAKIGCRSLNKHDSEGFFAALSLLPVGTDRIQLLSTVEFGIESDLAKKPWASHELFSQDKSTKDEKTVVDVINMLVSELEKEDRHREAAETLEDRGFLLEAADRYDKLSLDEDHSGFLSAKATALRVRFVELMLLSDKWEENRDSLLSKVELDFKSNDNLQDVQIDVRYASISSQALIAGSAPKLFSSISEFKDSVMWQYRSFNRAVESSSQCDLLENLPGLTTNDRLVFVHKLAAEMKKLGAALRRKTHVRSHEESILVTSSESYFDLIPKKLNPAQLETNPLVNLRLREVTLSEKCALPLSSGGKTLQHGFVQTLDRDKTHFMLSKFVYNKTASIMMELDDLIMCHEKSIRPCLAFLSVGACKYGHDCCFRHVSSIDDLREYIDCLQLHILFTNSMSTLHRGDANQGMSSSEPWISLQKKIEKAKQFSPSKLLDIVLLKSKFAFTLEANAESNAIALMHHSIEALKRYSTNLFFKLSMADKKQDIMHAITHWRVLTLCENATFASEKLHKEISRLEKDRITELDFKRNKFHYFINKRKREIFPRLWLWAVESARDDIMNSLAVVGRMIDTSLKGGLTSLEKVDQISLLEVNSVVLFGALSLTYSEVTSPPIFIPKHSYLQALLTGESKLFQLQGFGIPIKDVLLSYCHKRFDEVFEKVVLHLENTIAMFLSGDLLLPEKSNDDIARFVRALYLGVFICCNTVVFSTVGQDMDVKDYNRDSLSALPSLPLGGNIKKLTAALRKIIGDKLYPSYMEQSFAKTLESFLDLANSTNDLLMTSANDNFVLCRLRQREHEIDVHITENTLEVAMILSDIPLNETSDTFERWSKSASFLEKLSKTITSNAEEEQGRKSDELNAIRELAGIRKNRMEAKLETDIDDALIHFRHWKFVMRVFIRGFIRLMRGKFEEKDQKSCESDGSDLAHRSGVETGGVCIFDQIMNPLANRDVFSQQIGAMKGIFNNAIIDGIECTYCSIIYDHEVQNHRFLQWVVDGRRMPQPLFAREYNRTHFGSEFAKHPDYHAHIQSAMHGDNATKYYAQLDHFATVFARLNMSLELLGQIVHLCNEEGRRGLAHHSWYLNTAETCRELIDRLQFAHQELGNAGMIWSTQPLYQDVWVLLQRANELPQLAETFFASKQLEEAQMKQHNKAEENVPKTGESGMIENAIEELARGPYLNPEAPLFFPMS